MPRNPVLVVGASRGIGAEFVRRYRAVGAAVHATVRDPARPGELAGLDGVFLHALDVRDDRAISALATELAGACLDTVVHNAGVYHGSTPEEMMHVNAVAPIRTVEALLDAGAIAAGGLIAIMTSQAGARRGGSPRLGAYGSSKAALNDAFRERTEAWGKHGVIAIVVHPGWVRTDMGGPSASLSVEESVSGMLALFDDLTPAGHGRFWTWDGREHPW